ncbi:MAG: hypothetical protein U9N87_10890 [Planctomycetota bacterium]|nr:hypothetical protein [Planctomycetota bacterium]
MWHAHPGRAISIYTPKMGVPQHGPLLVGTGDGKMRDCASSSLSNITLTSAWRTAACLKK